MQALFSTTQVRELDRRAIEDLHIPGQTLMERAGAASFAIVAGRVPRGGRVAILCGAGNNAGDGYVVARLAYEAGHVVTVWQIGPAERLSPDAKAMREKLSPEVPVHARVSQPESMDLIVDGLLGIGLTRPVEGEYRTAIERVNASAAEVLALDVPSGVDADKGSVQGVAIRAATTITFIGCKQGLYTGAAKSLVGRIVFDDLGAPDSVYEGLQASARLMDSSMLTRYLPRRDSDVHKGKFGHVVVVGGDYGFPGAPRMAGEAAARVGAGLVSIATRPEHALGITGERAELMAAGITGADELESMLEKSTVVAIGPGLGQSVWAQSLLDRVLADDRPKVLDADALNLLDGRTGVVVNTILTPHPGEAARLLGCTTAEIQSDRFAALSDLIGRYNCVVVLKGAGTIVGAPGETPLVCSAGNPGMASGGMGDVLTGVIAGLCAQGLRPFDAAATAVWVHAGAADRAALGGGERGLLARDLMPYLRAMVNP